eukprot:CAMPEP_0181094902 /NCGR_PEP_ID=MMETSP1071-20121207/10238_1 /TAXON_ID=35127 /ORGANISM="Thalassiosira sp., Strain NH16" /LENGTH=62 /DNA_ID=CAMNT_0023177257 /DNA_START=60 /DNA_END=248 /DNA_ORIENTATION=+
MEGRWKAARTKILEGVRQRIRRSWNKATGRGQRDVDLGMRWGSLEGSENVDLGMRRERKKEA